MAAKPVAIERVGVFCSVGLDARQTAASVRAGVTRKTESPLLARNGHPIILGHLPSDVMPPLAADLTPQPRLTALQVRLLRLATPALQEVCESVAAIEQTPVLLAAPRPVAGRAEIVTEAFLPLLAQQSQVPLCIAKSRVYPTGHAGVFQAIHDAVEHVLGSGHDSGSVIVGGVDSYFDPFRLDRLQEERRLNSSGVTDGFTPGEGAAFLLLGARRHRDNRRGAALAQLFGVGLGLEKGHLYSTEPYLGEGLAQAFGQLFQRTRAQHHVPARTIFGGFNGENFHAKQWGVAFARSGGRIATDFQMHHPAEYTGDMGAASAPMMLAISALGLSDGLLPSPCLVWAASDAAERGAALLG